MCEVIVVVFVLSLAERKVLHAGIKHATGDSQRAYGILSSEQHHLQSEDHFMAVERRVREGLASNTLHVDQEYHETILETMVRRA